MHSVAHILICSTLWAGVTRAGFSSKRHSDSQNPGDDAYISSDLAGMTHSPLSGQAGMPLPWTALAILLLAFKNPAPEWQTIQRSTNLAVNNPSGKSAKLRPQVLMSQTAGLATLDREESAQASPANVSMQVSDFFDDDNMSDRDFQQLLQTSEGPHSDNLSTKERHGRKFEDMFARVASYSEKELSALDGERLNKLIQGTVSGARTPEVVTAFRILYEDYLPLRLGANFIFRWLDDTVKRAVEQQEKGLGTKRREKRRKKHKHAETDFDQMILAVNEWERLLQERGETFVRDGRLALVLNGTFVGAKTDGLVDALRILYEDYRILRLGGKLIFQLLKTVAPKP